MSVKMIVNKRFFFYYLSYENKINVVLVLAFLYESIAVAVAGCTVDCNYDGWLNEVSAENVESCFVIGCNDGLRSVERSVSSLYESDLCVLWFPSNKLKNWERVWYTLLFLWNLILPDIINSFTKCLGLNPGYFLQLSTLKSEYSSSFFKIKPLDSLWQLYPVGFV